MEHYPETQLQQLAPLLCVVEENERFQKECQLLLLILEESSISGKVWDNNILKNRISVAKYIVRVVETEEDVERDIESVRLDLLSHSVLSPFNPASDLFPNGVLSERWFDKYVRCLPFAVVRFHVLPAGPDEDPELAKVLADARERYSKHGVRYVAVVISDGDPVRDQDRVDALRVLLGLPRLTGLFYLNASEETVDRDAKVLALALVGNLRAPAADFYSAVEAHIKQRHKKYYNVPLVAKIETEVVLTPKFLEIRNLIKLAMVLQFLHPHNVEPCLTMLETAYERLVELLELVPEISSGRPHDRKLYAQFRNLLDILIFHLVRGYFSTEEPIAALRKHQAHIAQVLELEKSFPELHRLVWTAVQYQWLAELMDMVPGSIFQQLSPLQKLRISAKQHAVAYFGGFSFHDSFFLKIITHPALVYLKAYTLVQNVESAEFPLHLHSLELPKWRLVLLLAAHKANASSFSSPGLQQYLDWLMAEEYFASGDYESAAKQYLAVSSGSWLPGAALLKSRLAESFKRLNDEEELLRAFVSLSLAKKTFPVSQLALLPTKDHNIALLPSEKLFSVDAFLYNDNFLKDFYAFDTVVTQIRLEPTLDLLVLQELTGSKTAEIEVAKIEVNYEGRTVVLKGLGREKHVKIHLESHSEYEAPLLPDSIVQLADEVATVGKYKLELIEVFCVVRLGGSSNVAFTHSELHNFINRTYSPHAVEVYGPKPRVFRFERTNAVECMVQPYRPEVEVTFPQQPDVVLLGERLEVPVEMHFPKAAPKAVFSALSVQQKSHIFQQDGLELDYLTPQTNWQLLKDEEPLDILEQFAGNKPVKAVLQVSIRKPPVFQGNSQMRLQVEFELLASDQAGLANYLLRTVDVPVSVEPFSATFSVSPRLRPNSDMPSPFVLTANSDENFSMPLPLRVWSAEAVVESQNATVEVKSIKVVVNCKNPEILVEPVEETEKSQLFVTSVKHKFAHHRSVKVGVLAVVQWSRPGQNTNEYETEETEFTLPLQDPSVFLYVRGREPAQLHYVLENPTSRILTFTTNLSTEEAAMAGATWRFNHDNPHPLKQQAFPVLPFSRLELVYTGTFELEQKPVALPRLHVYDVNYKVSLATMPVEKDVFIKDTVMYMA